MTKKVTVFKDPRKKKPWVVRWFGEYAPITGKRKRYSRSFRRKVDAETYAAEKAVAFKQGEERDTSAEKTLKDLGDSWLSVKKGSRALRTITDYHNVIRRLTSCFGDDMPLCKITRCAAEKFIAEQRSMREGELSNWTRDKILRNCRAMFKKAVTWDWITNSPFDGVDRPSLTLRDWQYLGIQEYKEVFTAAPSLRWKAFYALAYTAGLRFGELFNLTWADIDFEKCEVRIRNREGSEMMPPFTVKTDQGVRTVPLGTHAVDILLDLHGEVPEGVPYVLLSKRQYENAVARWHKCSQKPDAWDCQRIVYNVPREFARHLLKAGIQRDEGKTLTVHTLRKCAGKNWADHIPNPKVTQMLMGHASLNTTMKFYNQVSSDDRKKAADAVDALFSQSDAQLTPTAQNE